MATVWELAGNELAKIFYNDRFKLYRVDNDMDSIGEVIGESVYIGEFPCNIQRVIAQESGDFAEGHFVREQYRISTLVEVDLKPNVLYNVVPITDKFSVSPGEHRVDNVVATTVGCVITTDRSRP